jgi:hypothetical protein
MVHALKEAWRVLSLHGTMIDVRPLSVVVPLEVIDEAGHQVAGDVDMTPDLKYDIAADQAIDVVIKDGIFTQSTFETFDYIYYWKTYHGMIVDFKERWEGEIIVAKEVLDKAQDLYKQKYPHARLRLLMRMMLGMYEKQGYKN